MVAEAAPNFEPSISAVRRLARYPCLNYKLQHYGHTLSNHSEKQF